MSEPTVAPAADTDTRLDQAVAEGGAYEVLRRRLSEQGQRLQGLSEALNAQRLQEFGDSAMAIAGRFRIQSEHNAVGRDIVQVGNLLLFGYNVFFGLKSTTAIGDVFSLYRLVETGEGYDVTPVDAAGTFLDDGAFKRDFGELYAYYKDARLVQLVVKDSKLLAAFQIGTRETDVRVFRWNIASTGELSYIDMRGERDIVLPPPFDFEWTRATKDMEISGRFPHLNILDTLFVETTGGDLTLKVENNTETGSGVYSEPVEDRTQSLDDARIEYARVGALILLKVLPYRETAWRGLVYNTLTGKVTRLDAIVQACIQLPEDHGIIFPGGYYLQNGEHKAFDATLAGMQYKRAIRSPNGEDVLYVFYQRDTGMAALLVYNLVQRRLQPPILAHGYARLADGRMVLFHADNDDPTRVHPMQVWNTPFASEEFAATRPPSASFLGRIGNAELVRAISNLFDLARDIQRQEVSAQRYQWLTRATRKLFDAHAWLDDEHTGGLATLLHEVASTGESVLDEFQKVQEIRRQSDAAMDKARAEHRALLGPLQPEGWGKVQDFVDALHAIHALRGHLLTLRDYRYIDVAAIDGMVQALGQAHERVGTATSQFLITPKALAPFEQRLAELDDHAGKASTATQLAAQVKAMQAMSGDLDTLSELMASLKVDDATQRTQVVDALSGLYARLNQARARAELRRKSLGSAEAVAQFGSQFALFGQSLSSALGMATTPEKADEQLARLMVQLEELESQFGEHEQFLGDILAKREELLEAFSAHKQALLDERQRRAQSLMEAALRILEGLNRRAERFSQPDELNAFFAGDALIQKLRDLALRLRELKDPVKADDIEARVKSARDQAIRVLRDRSELFEEGGNVIKLGPRHRFSVNAQPLDLTLLPHGDELALHLTGTDYRAVVDDPALAELKPYWNVTLESESPDLYRGEYLAGQLLEAALQGHDGASLPALQQLAVDEQALAARVREHAAQQYRDGYEKGIHDHDATRILQVLLTLHRGAGALVHAPQARALALHFWATRDEDQARTWVARIAAARALDTLGPHGQSLREVRAALAQAVRAALFSPEQARVVEGSQPDDVAAYLVDCSGEQRMALQVSAGAEALAQALLALQGKDEGRLFLDALRHLKTQPQAAWALTRQALATLAGRSELAEHARYIDEATALYLHREATQPQVHRAAVSATVGGLLGQHPRIRNGELALSIDDALARYRDHTGRFVPAWQRFHALRARIVQATRERMRLDEFKARPLTSFVRNRLINDVYLSIIGDNLAKQMGTVGENKRSDLMGLLMLISPPGYGKTTLMEYVAHRLGLVFMKINGPALGHKVRSLDPAQAPDATSRQELEKLNLALEMGSNVMLYVDDVQHTHSEFLQKFISLCDGTRRIEGVWQGQTRTYDMRGRKFAVVMAGNPYTETGEVFRIPDMLANRADIYNLGDVLGGMEEAFLLSYIENSLTSNPVLAPLATGDLDDLYLLLDKAAGKEVSTNALKHALSAAEVNEIVAVLQHLMKVRQVVYRVNQQYIASAAQADKYRVEPPFKLQGSYRNMNKLAEKVSPVMNDAELQRLISDHYLGESQLLTTGAEENLLKLGELRGTLGAEQQQRWAQIKADFLRNKAMGGEDADVGARMVAQLADIATRLDSLRSAPAAETGDATQDLVDALTQALQHARSLPAPAPTPAPVAAPPPLPPAPDFARLDAAAASLGQHMEPLLELLRASLGRQDQLNAAHLALMERLALGAFDGGGARVAAADADAGGGKRKRVRSPRSVAFERELEQLKFREDLDGGGRPTGPTPQVPAE